MPHLLCDILNRMEQQFKTHISSEHRLLDLHIRETLQYRDLIFLLVKKNFTAQYKQTILGPAWAIINPLLTTIVFTIVFGNLAKLPTTDVPGDYVIPSFLFFMIGTITWNLFSSTLGSTARTFIDNRRVMEKVYYPRLVQPLATALTCLISFGIQFALFACLWAYFFIQGDTSIRLTPMLLMLPVLIVHILVLAMGLGTILSAVTTKYRDLTMLVSFGLQLWRYVSPAVYGLQLVPAAYLTIYQLNPVAPILETMRTAVFGFGYFDLKFYAISCVVSLALMFIGLVMFSRIERTFMDTI